LESQTFGFEEAPVLISDVDDPLNCMVRNILYHLNSQHFDSQQAAD
jgi:hypothetical protein